MADYIKREAAIRVLLNDSPEQVGYSREDAADCIRYMDAADVAPVRHGRWIEYETSAYGGVEDGEPKWLKRRFFRCSECRKGSAVKSTYCPNCGAKMGGDGNG